MKKRRRVDPDTAAKRLANTSNKKKPRATQRSVPLPMGDDDRHLYSVRVHLVGPADLDLDDLRKNVLVAIAFHSSDLDPLTEYGCDVENETIGDPKRTKWRTPEGKKQERFGCVGFTGRKVPRDAETIRVLHVETPR